MDWTELSDPRSAFDAVVDAVKQTHLPDAFRNKRKFTAMVLTRAQPLSSVEGEAHAAAKYIFKARILGPNSPHLFLPDPCLLADAGKGETDAAINAIHQHTTFLGFADPTSGTHYVINPGDLVEVELHKGWFSYDLEQGKFNRVIQSSGGTQLTSKTCANIALTFAAMQGFSYGDAGSSPALPGLFTSGPLPEGQYTLTSTFRSSGRPNHHGIDLGAKRGTKVFAIADGTIEKAVKGCPRAPADKGCGGGFGNVVYIKHNATTPAGEAIYSIYAHLSANFVSKPESVVAGQHIGNVGNTGSSRGDHLHLEIHIGKLFGRRVDPQAYLLDAPAQPVDDVAKEDHDAVSYDDPPGVEGEDWKWIDEDEGEWDYL
jgi:murein DD-endopeptidase MepM/ murein hydrolase activator NlpD